MRIVVVYNAVEEDSSLDDLDVLMQVNAVSDALTELGHEAIRISCNLNLLELKYALEKAKPDCVFNLVESLEGHDRLIDVVPSLLDTMGLRYTGSPAESIRITSQKVMAKELMMATGLPTPKWIPPWPPVLPGIYRPEISAGSFSKNSWLIKSLCDHASSGLDEDKLVNGNIRDVLDLMKKHAPSLGGACFAECYIDGREFNLSLLQDENGQVQVLPPAEIVFEDYPENMLHIVGYKAKWEEGSFEYHHTPRRFDFPAEDKELLKTMTSLAKRCWENMGLKGYARVDFRVDHKGNPWILEVNTNPCLSPDAGFSAALDMAGIKYAKAVERIIFSAKSEYITPDIYCKSKRSDTQTDSVDTGTQQFSLDGIMLRYEPHPDDVSKVRSLIDNTGFFLPSEKSVLGEILQDSLQRGSKSGYYFILADFQDSLMGFSCYGPVACTTSSYDLFWIAVQPSCQGAGLGKILLQKVEDSVSAAGGSRLYVETASRPQYSGTRAFYEKHGYLLEATFNDFYSSGDNKMVYCKTLPQEFRKTTKELTARSTGKI
ncbi:MAG: GNAT family N-acetyltransferase [Desulfobacterales bacterium]|nr:GNAT family N-acetyltransferase [Desulfobacterales bacterium]